MIISQMMSFDKMKKYISEGNMPPACEAVLRTVGGAGGGDYHHPNKMNANGFHPLRHLR